MPLVTEAEFKKLIRKYTPQYIIGLHTKSKIRLSSQQIDELISMRDGGKKKRKTTKKVEVKNEKN